MSDSVYETVPVIPTWSSGAHHTTSKALPVPSKAAIDSYTSAHPDSRPQRPSLPDDVTATRPPLPPPRQRSSNSESEISSSPKHSGAAFLSRGKSVKGGGFVPGGDRMSFGSSSIRKSPSAASVESTELSLSAFVDKYASTFPLRVNVTKGFYGVSDQTAITTGDHYNFHFLKHIMVVVATDAKGEYSIPIESSLKVALLYETTNIEDAKKGIVFETCADLLSAKVQPRIIATCRQFNGGSAESSVESGEILAFLGGIVSTGNKLSSKGKRQVKFHSVTNNIHKILPESCSCGFTTSPKATGAPLSNLCLQKDWLPVKALVCTRNEEEYAATILMELNDAVLNFTAIREETTIVATGAAGNPSEVLEVMELPKDLNIEVELFGLKPAEMSGLVENTQNRYDSFTPDSVIHYTNKPTLKMYDIQCALYKTVVGVRTEFQSLLVKPCILGQRKSSLADVSKTDIDDLPPFYGVHTSTSPSDTSCTPSEGPSCVRDQRYSSQPVEVPKIPDTLPSTEVSTKASNLTANYPEAYASVYDRRANIISSGSPKRPENLSGDSVTVRVSSDHTQDYVTMTPNSDPGTIEAGALANLQQRIARLEESRKEYERNIQETISKLSEDLAKLSKRLSDTLIASEEVRNQCSVLQDDVNRMKVSSESLYSVSRQPGPRLNGKLNGHVNYGSSPPSVGDLSFPPDPKVDERNKEFLMSMDVDKVLKLLECMSLAQYQDAFMREQINGELLCECDETVLQNDLGVTSKLHRMRLIKVITGRHSAKSLLDGSDPYAGRFVS